MASSVSYDSRPALRRPVFIEGLPGVGNIGKLAADLISEQLGAIRFARIYSDDLPPQVVLDDECIAEAACNELWYADIGDRDVVFLLGEFQGTTPAGQYNLSETAFRIVLPHDPSLVLTLGGYGTGQLTPAPRVLGAVSRPEMKPDLEAAGVGFYPGEPQGGIVGAAARPVPPAHCPPLAKALHPASVQEPPHRSAAAREAPPEKSQAEESPEDLVYIR